MGRSQGKFWLKAMTTFDYRYWKGLKGFMDEQEAERLFETAKQASKKGPVLEIGSYCGKSAYVIGCACRENSSILFSIDHHKGSEEQQPGQEYFDSDLFDEHLARINTLPFFQQTLAGSSLEDIVIPIIGTSEKIGRFWATPLSMVFIDGGHSYEAAFTDYEVWTPHIIPGGYLVFHDIFLDPETGGQAPRKVYDKACKSGSFDVLGMTKTLGVLKKI